MFRPTKPLPLAEFIVLLAFMVSIVAMATDIMLPALSMIGEDLRVGDANDVQLVVSSLFLGFSIGQLVVGPLSDTYGRKPMFCPVSSAMPLAPDGNWKGPGMADFYGWQ